MREQATLESSRKAGVAGKPTSEDLGGQLAFAQSAQATFEVSCPTLFVVSTAASCHCFSFSRLLNHCDRVVLC